MIRFLKAAVRGVRMELAAGESGWEYLSGAVDPWAMVGSRSKAGKTVSATSALSLSAVWACVNRNAQVTGALPLAVYERQSGGARVRIEPDLAEILTRSPNAALTANELWESMAAHVLLQGNAFAEKQMIGRRFVGLRPMFNVTPIPRGDGRFDYREARGGGVDVLPPERVLHVRGFGGGDGLGMSAIKHGVQSMGAALAADEAAAKVFANGLMASGLLESDRVLSEAQRAQVQESLLKYTSSERAGKIMTMEGGLKFRQLQMNPEDAQLLDTRRFQVEDVCRWFGTPPVVIGHNSGQTMWGTGVEAIMLAWLTLGLNPLLRRIEARLAKDIIPPERRGRWSVEWDRESLLQMDSKAKGEFLSKLVAGGIMSSDEAREKLALPRRGGVADALRAQIATAPIEQTERDGE